MSRERRGESLVRPAALLSARQIVLSISPDRVIYPQQRPDIPLPRDLFPDLYSMQAAGREPELAGKSPH